jgi:kanamycin kinase
VADWERVHAGKSEARVWRGAGVHRKEGDEREIAAEADRLVWLGGRGIPCPRVVEHRPGVLVTTTAPGRPGAEEWPEALRPRMVSAVAATLRALHALPVAECPFDRSLAVTVPAAERAVAAGEVDLSDLDGARAGWSGERLLAELHRTRPASEDLVVGHGDTTLENLFFGPGGELTAVIDAGRLGRADRHNDLAIAVRELSDAWHPRYADQLLREYGAADPAKLTFYQLLDEFF